MKIRSISLCMFVFIAHMNLSHSEQLQYQKNYDQFKVDLNKLADKIELSARGQHIEMVRLRLLKRLKQDKDISNELKTYLISNSKKTLDNSVLLRNLNKLINVYDDVIDLINKDKTIHYNFNKVEHLDQQSGIVEIIAISTLLTVRNLKNLSSDKAADIRIDLKIDAPNEVFDDLPVAVKLSSKISLIDASVKGKLALWVPSFFLDDNNQK
ncbi:MAG: hypothetical protein Q8S31_07910 [Alphaproteobacteria bacterium]|nr:hypothetical protein [Alphaproteobacteria bacterium]